MLKLFNTLTRSIEEFLPIVDNHVGVYSCGPTVYDYQHIGHMRRYVGDDILIRVLRLNGYEVTHAMNITDVGHLVSDSDTGEDKMEKGAKKFGLSVWDIAAKFEGQFWDSTDKLNILRPDVLMHATDYIDEQISLIAVLEKKGYTYKLEDGIYFDTSKFKDYFVLSRQNPEELKKGARVEFISGKKNVADFALWKFSYSGGRSFDFAHDDSASRRQMEWDSPWGVGFPGWHIECSAMAMDALGSTLDIHTGGIDHIAIHHSNEIAQSEAATGERFVNYWVHHNFLIVNNEKMSKSLGNFYTVQDVMDKGFDSMSLRYLYLQTHYRQEMNFTWESLEAAQTAYKKLINVIANAVKQSGEEVASSLAERDPRNDAVDKFMDALNDDLNTAKGLAIMWEVVNSSLSASEKVTALSVMDNVLGLNLFSHQQLATRVQDIPQEVWDLVYDRESFRKAGDFAAADEIRKKIADLGFTIQDTKEGPQIEKK
jgi:cysteinyl-tRNA synthetase